MTPREFCLWLSGFLEISGLELTRKLNAEQVDIIRKRLAGAMRVIDPPPGEPASTEPAPKTPNMADDI